MADPFDDDMRLTKGRYYPPEPREECCCTPATYWEPASICAHCEARAEADSRINQIRSEAK